jgi:hypothetical protein
MVVPTHVCELPLVPGRGLLAAGRGAGHKSCGLRRETHSAPMTASRPAYYNTTKNESKNHFRDALCVMGE